MVHMASPIRMLLISVSVITLPCQLTRMVSVLASLRTSVTPSKNTAGSQGEGEAE